KTCSQVMLDEHRLEQTDSIKKFGNAISAINLGHTNTGDRKSRSKMSLFGSVPQTRIFVKKELNMYLRKRSPPKDIGDWKHKMDRFFLMMSLGFTNAFATFDQGTVSLGDYNMDIATQPNPIQEDLDGVYPQAIPFNDSLLPIYILGMETVLSTLLSPFSNDLLDQMPTNAPVVQEEESTFGVNQELALAQRPSIHAETTGVVSDSDVSPLSSPTSSVNLGLSHKKTRNRQSKFKKSVSCSCGTNLERILHIGNHLLRR
ncbi:hypothetical protein HDU99_000809, partial [Rhizoclosmatium hyalinum]